MPIIDPSPSTDELQALAAIFKQAETSLLNYLLSDAGRNDPNEDALTAAAISLNNISTSIVTTQLHLATQQGLTAVATINKAAAELQHAIIIRNAITKTLNIVKSIVTFGAAIAAGDIPSIIQGGGALIALLDPSSEE